MTAELAIIVVNWNTRDLLHRCLESIYQNPPRASFEVWVVDNASRDGSAEMVSLDFPQVILIRSETNDGFARANNRAIRASNTRFVLLLNSDTVVFPGALDAAIDASSGEDRVVAARLLNVDGSLQHSCFRFPSVLLDTIEALFLHRLFPPVLRGALLLGGYWDHGTERFVDWALGAFLLAPRKAFTLAGTLPEEYFLFGEDMEWCYRARSAGFPTYFVPTVAIEHVGNQSAKLLPREWRVRRTHEAKWRFLTAHHSPTTAGLLRSLHIASYEIRVRLFRCIPGRRRDAVRYRAILRALSPSVRK